MSKAAAYIWLGIAFLDLDLSLMKVKQDDTRGVLSGIVAGITVLIDDRIDEGSRLIARITFVYVKANGYSIAVYQFYSYFSGVTGNLVPGYFASQNISACRIKKIGWRVAGRKGMAEQKA